MAEGMKWIKLSTNIFDKGKIKLIQKMPAGDTILVIWLMTLTLCGRECQDGVLMISRDMPYTIDMLATIFDRDLATVKLAFQTFEQLGMISYIDGVYSVPKWSLYQSASGYERVKELARKRKQRQREREKNATSPLLQASSEKCHVTSRDVTPVEKNRKEKNRKDKNNNNKPLLSLKFFDSNFHPICSSYEKEVIETMIDEYGDTWVLNAMKEAIKQNVRKLKYVDAILKNWKEHGIQDKKSAPVLDEQYNDIPF